MQELKAETPIESPAGTDLVERLIARLRDEGFTTDQPEEDWHDFGEIIYRRSEKISFASGQTVFIFTRVEELNERILRQTSESVVHTYKAKNPTQKALSVLQSITVYHCLVAGGDQPHSELLGPYVTRRLGATFIPVILVPDINQVVYPDVEEKVGSISPRIDYLKFLLGERREPVNMHRSTLQAMWVSVGVLAVLLIAIVVSFFHG
jgi:hypothetical protein